VKQFLDYLISSNVTPSNLDGAEAPEPQTQFLLYLLLVLCSSLVKVSSAQSASSQRTSLISVLASFVLRILTTTESSTRKAIVQAQELEALISNDERIPSHAIIEQLMVAWIQPQENFAAQFVSSVHIRCLTSVVDAIVPLLSQTSGMHLKRLNDLCIIFFVLVRCFLFPLIIWPLYFSEC
jgi:hypothetical protein